jgi:putative holliday junction resolvase
MARIVSIDYGGKRCGIATTDPLQIIASALTTVATDDIVQFIKDYVAQEEVEAFVVGEPFRADGSHSDIEVEIKKFIVKLKEICPNQEIHRVDESFSSIKAKEALIQSGVKKKKRRQKKLLDSTAATIILQEYLETHL